MVLPSIFPRRPAQVQQGGSAQEKKPPILGWKQEVTLQHIPEPPDCDAPVHCPPPEPCISHDGMILQERIAARRAAIASSKNVKIPLFKRHSIAL
ncbi:uncharacterized protein LOC112346708 isoform X1 [Selaginella moellendorffii]|uniref:uncharacterized protein LOC112346708 isoform X1 n=1 Tax=Selaginella moellendorffii TaxID=88036 RepID=UPI000D1CFA90|nr:uncharacterized protein LOC112346708 isoform X1 [Selaginella moellendorffii]|eukprot:XP_024531994.1 uncharacterized protein LOC112346708 isoform X1 [Selaginella moellendorffii]